MVNTQTVECPSECVAGKDIVVSVGVVASVVVFCIGVWGLGRILGGKS